MRMPGVLAQVRRRAVRRVNAALAGARAVVALANPAEEVVEEGVHALVVRRAARLPREARDGGLVREVHQERLRHDGEAPAREAQVRDVLDLVLAVAREPLVEARRRRRRRAAAAAAEVVDADDEEGLEGGSFFRLALMLRLH